VLKMSMSVDGFVAGRLADSDWMFRGSTPESATWVFQTLAGAGIHAIGRKSFEAWAGFWPSSGSRMAGPMNDIPKVVFTRQSTFDPGALSTNPQQSVAERSWTQARVASDNLEVEVERLKQEPGDYILAQGGVSFARSLVGSGLVDEYRFAVMPVVLGSGEQLFAGLVNELDLELVSSTAFSGGAIGNIFRPKLPTGFPGTPSRS
jgi:dihydrofolate reductase